MTLNDIDNLTLSVLETDIEYSKLNNIKFYISSLNESFLYNNEDPYILVSIQTKKYNNKRFIGWLNKILDINYCIENEKIFINSNGNTIKFNVAINKFIILNDTLYTKPNISLSFGENISKGGLRNTVYNFHYLESFMKGLELIKK